MIHELLDFFFRDQRPDAWHQWAEVVYRDPKTPKFIGDMPHTWVGSDFIRSVIDFFAYDEDDALVIAAGVPQEWLGRGPVRIEHLQTQFGELNITIRREEQAVTVSLTGAAAPPRGFIVKSPIDDSEKVVPSLPADVVFRQVECGRAPRCDNLPSHGQEP